MAVTNIAGLEMAILLNGVPVGCADNIGLTLTTAMSTAACRAAGGWAENIAGQHSWGASVSGILRVATGTDASGNRTGADIALLQINRTPVTVVFGSPITGDTKYTGTALISEYAPSGPLEGAGTFSATLVGSGPLVPAVNA